MSTDKAIVWAAVTLIVFALVTPAIIMLWRLFFKYLNQGC